MSLSSEDQALLDFAGRRWNHRGAQADAIRAEFNVLGEHSADRIRRLTPRRLIQVTVCPHRRRDGLMPEVLLNYREWHLRRDHPRRTRVPQIMGPGPLRQPRVGVGGRHGLERRQPRLVAVELMADRTTVARREEQLSRLPIQVE